LLCFLYAGSLIMKKRFVLIAAAWVLSLHAYAQDQTNPGAAISDAALGKAMADARARTERANREMGYAPTKVPQQPTMTIPAEKLNAARAAPIADPMEIASRYKNLDQRPDAPTEDLLVFISTSMPIEALRKLGNQARRARAILVLRGIKGGLSKNNYEETLRILKPVVETGASIQINPNLFKQFSVKTVPTFVLTEPGRASQGCEGNSCMAGSISVQGDVSLDYALEYFSQHGGAMARVAEERLRKMETAR